MISISLDLMRDEGGDMKEDCNVLDNLEIYSKEPYKRAFSAVQKYPECLSKYYKRGLEIGIMLKDFKFSRIVYLGIGGSAIVGDFISTLVEDVPVKIHRDYTLFKINPDDLVIAVSYSGDTAEIFPTLLGALKMDRNIVVVSSGGRLVKIAEKKHYPIVMLEPGIPPRYAFPHTFGALLGLLESLNVKIESLRESLDEVMKVREKVDYKTPAEINIAKKIALKVFDNIPVIYAYGKAAPIAYRFKCQLNENSKLFAHFCEIPEALHNDIEGLTEEAVLLAPRLSNEPREIDEVYRILSDLLQERYVELKVGAGSIIEEMTSLLVVVDYISLYVAVLRNVDPLSLAVIPKLKEQNRAYREILRSVDERVEGL